MSFYNLMTMKSIRLQIRLTVIFLFVSLSARADAPIGVSSFIHIPSEESESLKELKGFFEHPQICPLDGNIISFEMRTENGVKLYWYNIIQDSLVEINPPVINKGKSDIFEEFGMTIKKVVTENYDLDWCPVISPYGEIVAVYTHSKGDYQDVYLYYLQANKHVLLTENSDKNIRIKNSNSRWSPDGSMIAFQLNRTGKNNLYLLTGMDNFLSFPRKYSPILYSIPGNNKIESSVISWNPNKQTGILTFTELLNSGTEKFYTSSLISLPDSQSYWMMIDPDKKNMISPSWDPLQGEMIAFYSYQWEKTDIENKLRNYNINIRKTYKDKQGKISVSSISNIPINEYPVLADYYRGPIWLDNSNYILYLQKNNDGTTSLQYSDIGAWTKGERPWNGELVSSEKYRNMRHLSIEKQKIIFVGELRDSTFIIIGNLKGEGTTPPIKYEYKLAGHPRFAEFINQIGLTPNESFIKKIVLNPVGGKDFILNRPIVGLGLGALLILLNNNGDEGNIPGSVWDDLPDPPNPGN